MVYIRQPGQKERRCTWSQVFAMPMWPPHIPPCDIFIISSRISCGTNSTRFSVLPKPYPIHDTTFHDVSKPLTPKNFCCLTTESERINRGLFTVLYQEFYKFTNT